MKVDLIWVGKTTDSFVQSAINDYSNRIGKYTRFKVQEIRNIKKKVSVNELIELESAEIRKVIEGYEVVYLLDEKGVEYTSEKFSGVIEKMQIQGTRSVCFVIGGAYGLTDELKQNYKTLALSKMTFSHQFIRVIFLEQLYRAYTIMNNEPYHHS